QLLAGVPAEALRHRIDVEQLLAVGIEQEQGVPALLEQRLRQLREVVLIHPSHRPSWMIPCGTAVRDVPTKILGQALGRNALTMASCVVREGPSIRSMQYGMAGKTASRQSRMALGLPGRLTISEWPRTPAICRDRIAVGTTFSETARISSPKPSRSLSQTASVASGVTSRRAGPVPPVVPTRQQFS